MKKTILTIAAISLIFTSCTKEDELQPVTPTTTTPVVVIPSEPCLDTCGYIIYAEHWFQNQTDTLRSDLTLATSCDTVDIVVFHTLEEVQFHSGMEVCFDRSEVITK